MKSIIKSLLVITAVAAVAGGATYSYFSDSVVASGITMSSGNADLKISNDNSNFGDGIDLTSQNLGLTELYPGWELNNGSGYPFYLRNDSDSAIGLDTYFKVETTDGDYALCNAVNLKLVRSGGYATDWHSLCWWRDNFTGNGWRMMNTAGEQEVIPQKEVHQWTAYVQVDPNAGNEIQDLDLKLRATFFAEQSH